MALSVDSEDDARTMQQEENISFPVIYGLDCESEADKIGAYYDEEGPFFHATNFLLRDGKIFQATYSSGPLGRLEAEQVVGLVDFYSSEGS